MRISEAEIMMLDSIDSTQEEAAAFDSSDELQATPAAMDTTPLGQDCMPRCDVMTMVRAYGNAYSDRGMSGKLQDVKKEGGNEASEKCVANALKWLANHQMPDGGWSFDLALCPVVPRPMPRLGKTGRSPQCGHRPGPAAVPRQRTDAQRQQEVQGHDQQRPDVPGQPDAIGPQGGALNEPGGNMYSHGIATIAICEAYAMTNDRNLLLPAKAALNFVASSQDPKGGGWRYQPREQGDTSILGWQLMALKSGQMAGLSHPAETSATRRRCFSIACRATAAPLRLSGARHGQRRHRGDRPALPHVSWLEERQSRRCSAACIG